MPMFGFGLYLALAILCAVHVVRTGQSLYWLVVLFGLPVVGSIVYFIAVFLPASRLRRGALRAMDAAARALDPQRDVRSARTAFEEAPTAQNQMRLASALLAAGDAPAAAQAYEACLDGPFARDLETRFGAARSYVECERYADALVLLEPLRHEHPDRAEPVALLTARALAGVGRHADARAAFASAEQRFGSYEAKAEYAVWAYAVGDRLTSARLQVEAERIAARWNAHARELNAQALRRLRAAREVAQKT